MRLIDADAFEHRFEDIYCKGCENYEKVRCRACVARDVADLVDSQPTVIADSIKDEEFMFDLVTKSVEKGLAKTPENYLSEAAERGGITARLNPDGSVRVNDENCQ